MLSVYLIALLVGGFLLALSVFGGSDMDADADVHADFDADVHADFDADVHADLDGDVHAEVSSGVDFVLAWLPFASLRFWTFFGAFFGLTGVVMTVGKFVGKGTALGLSIGVGYICGFGITTVLRKLMANDVNSSLSPKDLTGVVGEVVLPIRRGETGKIRLQLKGRVIELLAETDEETELSRGQRCMIYEMTDDGAAMVARTVETTE